MRFFFGSLIKALVRLQTKTKWLAIYLNHHKISDSIKALGYKPSHVIKVKDLAKTGPRPSRAGS